VVLRVEQPRKKERKNGIGGLEYYQESKLQDMFIALKTLFNAIGMYNIKDGKFDSVSSKRKMA